MPYSVLRVYNKHVPLGISGESIIDNLVYNTSGTCPILFHVFLQALSTVCPKNLHGGKGVDVRIITVQL